MTNRYLTSILFLLTAAIAYGDESDNPFQSLDDVIKETALISYEEILEGEPGIKMSLSDCIYIALRDNETVQNAYLNRITQILSFEDSLNSYRPNGTISFEAGAQTTGKLQDQVGKDTASFTYPNISLSQKLSTGGTISYGWTTLGNFNKQGSKPSYTNNWSLKLTQPLIKNGPTVGDIALKQAFLTERGNILTLKSTIQDQVSGVIKAYRAYAAAIVQFEIDKRGYEQSLREMDNIKALVEAGRRARNDLVDREAQLKQREFDFEAQKNTKDEARLTLLRTMNLSTDTMLVPKEIRFEIVALPTVDNALDIAYKNNISYLQALIAMRNQEFSYRQAVNGESWDVTVSAKLTGSDTNTTPDVAISNSLRTDKTDYTLGISAGKSWNINKNTRVSTLLGAKASLKSQKNSLNQTEEELKQNIKNAIRNLKISENRVNISEIQTELRKKQFAGEKLKYQAGQTSSFDYLARETDLINAESSKLTTKINYLNSLTDLDVSLGTLLDSWGIKLHRRLEKRPEFVKNYYSQLANNK